MSTAMTVKTPEWIELVGEQYDGRILEEEIVHKLVDTDPKGKQYTPASPERDQKMDEYRSSRREALRILQMLQKSMEESVRRNGRGSYVYLEESTTAIYGPADYARDGDDIPDEPILKATVYACSGCLRMDCDAQKCLDSLFEDAERQLVSKRGLLVSPFDMGYNQIQLLEGNALRTMVADVSADPEAEESALAVNYMDVYKTPYAEAVERVDYSIERVYPGDEGAEYADHTIRADEENAPVVARYLRNVARWLNRGEQYE